MPSKRRFFVVAWNEGIDFAMYCDSDPADTVAHWLEIIPAAMNSQAGPDGAMTEVMIPGDSCLLYDWSLNTLPPDVRVNQIPKPGVVFAVKKGSHLEQAQPAPDAANAAATAGHDAAPAADSAATETGGEYALVYLLKRELWREKSKYAERVQRFISSPEAEYEPLPITRYDAFISYSSDDLALATEIADDLAARKLRIFLASRDLAAGTLWTEEVRQTLLESRVLLIVLTPNSATRPWVMCEVGASWALGMPLVPALMFVDPKTLPEVITAYQCRRIETAQGRKALVDEVDRLCQGAD